MSSKLFKDLADNDIFKSKGIEYKKIPQFKVSCCRSVNAEQVDNANQKTFIQPSEEVEINDQQ